MSQSIMMLQCAQSSPSDPLTRRVLADALEEQGEDKEAASQRRIADALEHPTSVCLSASAERQIRKAAGSSRCPVKVVNGAAPPTTRGYRGCSYKTRYIASTFRVEVGVEWLITEGYIS